MQERPLHLQPPGSACEHHSMPCPYACWLCSLLRCTPSELPAAHVAHVKHQTPCLLQIASMAALHKPMKEAGIGIADFVRHLSFVYEWMFAELLPYHFPRGRVLLLVDMEGVSLGQVGDVCTGCCGAGSRMSYICDDMALFTSQHNMLIVANQTLS